MIDSDGLPVPRRYWSAVTIWLVLIMSVLDGSICNVALPAIARDIATAPAEAVWIVNAYQLTVLISLLPLAALGDVVGYRRVFLSGLFVFTVASLGCIFAHDLPSLALVRGLQGFGAAGVMSVNGALVRFTYPLRTLGSAAGINALVVSAGAVLGPTVAAAILALGSWQWLFAINIPIGIVAFVMGRWSLPESKQSGAFDLAGTLLSAVAFGFGFVSINLLTKDGFSPEGTGGMTVAIIAAIFLVRRSLRQTAPLMPIDLLRRPLIALTAITSMSTFCAQVLTFVSLPFYLQDVLHRTQVETGLLMTPWPVAIGIGSPIAGWLADRFPAAILSGVGLLVLALGLTLLALLPVDASNLEIGSRMAMCGLGFGFFQSPNNRTMLSSAPLERSGAAGGLLATARSIGQISGATLAAISFRLVSHAETVALSAAATFALMGAIASVTRLRHRQDGRSAFASFRQ